MTRSKAVGSLALAVLLAAAFIAGAEERAAAAPKAAGILPQGPPRVSMAYRLGTGAVAHVTIDCVNEDFSRPFVQGLCWGENDGPVWRVIRCTDEPCDFAYPLTVVSDFEITFPTSTAGTYYVSWQNRAHAPTKGVQLKLQRGPVEYPPPSSF